MEGGSSRVKGAGLGQAPHSVLRGGCMELLSSLKAPHACPCILGRMNSLGRHPVPMEMSPELRRTAGSAQHEHRLHHPSLHGEPRNRAGKVSGWCSGPSLGNLPSEFCLLPLYSLTPHKAWCWGAAAHKAFRGGKVLILL